VREDEAKAAAEEAEKEQQRIDAENKKRLDALRRKAGSPSLDDDLNATPGPSSSSTAATGGEGRSRDVEGGIEDPGDLPSSSAFKQLESGGLMERHKKAKARAEKEEKRRKERLDFDFPSDTARKEKRRAEKEGAAAAGPLPGAVGGLGGMGGFGTLGSDGESMWTSGGHLNLFADLERVCCFPPCSSCVSCVGFNSPVCEIGLGNVYGKELTVGGGECDWRTQYWSLPWRDRQSQGP